MYQDKTLVCRDCGQEFTFTAGEQEFYAERGFQNEPTRCRECRQAHKANRAGAQGNARRGLRQCGCRTPGSLSQERPSHLLQRVLSSIRGR